MNDERDTDPTIPIVVHTPAELDAEETFRDKLDDEDAAHSWVGWVLLIAATLCLAGAVVRSCWW